MRDYIFNNMIPFDTLLLSIYYGPSMDSTCIGQTFPSIEVISKKFKMIYSTKPFNCSSDHPGYWIITLWRRKSINNLIRQFYKNI